MREYKQRRIELRLPCLRFGREFNGKVLRDHLELVGDTTKHKGTIRSTFVPVLVEIFELTLSITESGCMVSCQIL